MPTTRGAAKELSDTHEKQRSLLRKLVRMTPKIEKLQKQVEDLRALIERGEGGEREAARNAYGKKRIELLEAQVEWLIAQNEAMQLELRSAHVRGAENHAREFRQPGSAHASADIRGPRSSGAGGPTIVVPTITTTPNYGSAPPPPPRPPGDPCPICGRNISRKIILDKLDPYLRAGHQCPHGVPCAASDSTKAHLLNGIPPESQQCCRSERMKERHDKEDGSL